MLALLAGVAMLAYPFMPVTQHTATYRWQASQGPVALPLNPYRPERLVVGADCVALRGHTGTVLTTVRAVDDGMQAGRLDLGVRDDRLVLDLRGQSLDGGPLAACERVELEIGTERVVIRHDGQEVLSYAGDLRPAMDSLAPTPGVAGLTAEVVADTQFDSSPTAAKVVLGCVAIALLAVALALAVTLDRPRRRLTLRLRLGVDDLVVLLATAFGVIAGGATDDDGFIAQIMQTPAMSGYVGNYVRWNNAPEAPFGWFYEPYARWGEVSMEPVWLRLLPWLLGLAAWLVLRHGLLPRLLPRPNRVSRVALMAGFTLLWLVFCNSLRPEIFFALGAGIVLLCVLDALHRRSTTPLLLGALVAGLTVGAGPTGLFALAPFVIAAPRLWRWLRPTSPRTVGPTPSRRLSPTRLRLAALAAVWLASLGAIVLVMFGDQTWASVQSANHARTAFGPIYPFWEDYQRYWKLWWSFAARQFSVYLPAIAIAYLLWQVLRRHLPGLNRLVAIQVIGGAVALLIVLVLGPTKLPHHFGALLLLGPLAMAAATHLLTEFTRSRARTVARSSAFLIGGSVVVLGLALHYDNTWWKLSTLGLALDKKALAVGPVPVWPGIVLAGLVLAGWLLRRIPRRGLSARWALAYAVALAVLSGSQYANFALAAVDRGPERYTMASAAISAMMSDGCKLERSLHYEPDPAAGVLPGAEPGSFITTHEAGLPVWAADPLVPDGIRTEWYDVPADVRSGRWPLVIAASGIDEHHRVTVEYDTGELRPLTATRKTLGTSQLSDIRLHPSEKVTRFRIIAESDGPATLVDTIGEHATGELIPFVVAAPRVPVTRPLLELAQESTVAVAWNLAFFAPCLDTPWQARGRVQIADYILSDSEQPGNMSYHSRSGGPFAGVIGLTVPSRVPMYAAGDYTESEMSALDLVALVPAYGTDLVTAELGSRVRAGWAEVPAVP